MRRVGVSEVRLKGIQLALPECTVLIDPAGYFIESAHVRVAVPQAPSSFESDQTALGEDLHVPGNRRPADVKPVGDTVQRELPRGKKVENGPSAGICNCLENVSSHRKAYYVTEWLHIKDLEDKNQGLSTRADARNNEGFLRGEGSSECTASWFRREGEEKPRGGALG